MILSMRAREKNRLKAFYNCHIGELMPKKKTTYVEMLNDSKGLPKVEKITAKLSKKLGTGTIVIPAPIEVDEMMRNIPTGKLVTINDIRVALAKNHKAIIGCPMATRIFAWVAAHAAEEREQSGAKNVAPYWRTLKSGGVLNEKYSGGVEA
jgi:hypothetical protein